jgi:ankyrin repeat protein
MAALCGQQDVVEVLVNRRADVNAKDYSNKTALFYASANEHTAIVDILKKAGARE